MTKLDSCTTDKADSSQRFIVVIYNIYLTDVMLGSDVNQLLLGVHFVLNFKICKPATTKGKLRKLFTKQVNTFLQNNLVREQTRYFHNNSLVACSIATSLSLQTKREGNRGWAGEKTVKEQLISILQTLQNLHQTQEVLRKHSKRTHMTSYSLEFYVLYFGDCYSDTL